MLVVVGFCCVACLFGAYDYIWLGCAVQLAVYCLFVITCISFVALVVGSLRVVGGIVLLVCLGWVFGLPPTVVFCCVGLFMVVLLCLVKCAWFVCD